MRLAQAHRELLEEEIKSEAAAPTPTRRQKAEKFLSDHKGILAFLSFLAALAFGLYRIFIG
jgi:hypothetical protein